MDLANPKSEASPYADNRNPFTSDQVIFSELLRILLDGTSTTDHSKNTLNKFWHLLFIKMKTLIIHMLWPGYSKKVLKVQEMKLQGIKIKKQGTYLG